MSMVPPGNFNFKIKKLFLILIYMINFFYLEIQDPSPYLYNTAIFTFAALAGVAGLAH